MDKIRTDEDVFVSAIKEEHILSALKRFAANSYT